MGLLDRFLTEVLGLTKAPEYLPTFFWAVVGFTFVHLIIAPLITRRWFPFAYDGKTRIARNNWCVGLASSRWQSHGLCCAGCAGLTGRSRNIHVVSQVHALIVVPFSLYCIFSEGPERGKTARDRTFGWDPLVGHVQAIAAGYAELHLALPNTVLTSFFLKDISFGTPWTPSSISSIRGSLLTAWPAFWCILCHTWVGRD